MRHLVRVVGGGTPSKDVPDFWNGDIPWVSPKDMKSSPVTDSEDHITRAALRGSPTSVIPTGCVLIVVRSGILQRTIPTAINDVPVALNQDLKALICHGIRPRFLYYLITGLESRLLHEWRKVGATVESLEMRLVLDTVLAVPPERLQDAISDYLDRKLKRLAALMAAQTRLVEDIEERFALAQQELLIGPPTRSEAPGIHQGRLPSGWAATPFRWLFREIDERSTGGLEPLLSVSQTRGIIRQDELGDRAQRAQSYVGYKLCKAGDLVVNRMWVYYGALGVAHETGLVSPDYSVFRPREPDVDAELVAITLKTPAFVAEMTMRVRGIGSAFQGSVRKPRLHPKDLGEILIPVPPKADHDSVVRRLIEIQRRANATSLSMTRFIALLEERRHALITAAVSGEIDVTVEAA